MADPVSAAVSTAHTAARESLPFEDQRDLAAAGRGLLAGLAAGEVVDAEGRTVWDAAGYRVDGPGCWEDRLVVDWVIDGEAAAWTSLLATLDPPDPGFDIVLP